MRKILAPLALVIASSLCSLSQEGNTITLKFAGVPTGNCSFIMYGQNGSNGDLYNCFNGTWTKIASGGGGGGAGISGTPSAGQIASWVSATAIKGVTISGNGTIDSTGILSVTGSAATATLNFSSLNPNGGTLTMLAVGGTYPTLHDAVAACPAVGCIVFDTKTENLTNNSAGNPVQPFCSGTWVATDPYTCTAGTWKFVTVYLGFGKWTSDYPIIYGTSYEHIQGSGVSVAAGGATTGTLIASTASWDQTGPDPGHPLVRLSPLFTGSNYQFNNTLKDLTLDLSTGSAAGKVGNCVVNDGADENTIVSNVKCYAAKPPTATSATLSIVRTGCPGSCLATATVTNIQGCNGSTNPCTLQNGQQIIIAGSTAVGESFNGTYTVSSATGTPTTSFTYKNGTATNESATVQGTVQVAGAFIEWLGNGAQNSRLEELYLLSGGTGYQDANTNGVLLSSYSTRGINGITEVMGNGTTPNAGVLVTGGSTDPSLRNIHCEGWLHCLQYTNSAGGVVEQLTVGNTSAGDAINIGASTIALSLFDININTSGTLSLLTDNTFTTPFVVPASTAHMGYYLLGSTGSGQHTYKSDLKSFADIDFALSFVEQTAPTIQAVTGLTQDPIYASSTDHRLHLKNSVDGVDAPIVSTPALGTAGNPVIYKSGSGIGPAATAQYNIVDDGGASTVAADNSAAIASSSTAAVAAGKCVLIPAGTFKVTAVVAWAANASLCPNSSGTIQANAAIAAVLQTPLNTPTKNAIFQGATLDGNNLAIIGLDQRNCNFTTVTNMVITGATTYGLHMGDNTSSTTSFQCNVGAGVTVIRPSGTAQVASSVALFYDYASDSTVDNSFGGVGYDIGVKSNRSHNFLSGHVWAYSGQLMTTGFDLNASDDYLIDGWYADTPQTACVKVESGATRFWATNGLCYNGLFGGVDNVAVGFQFVSSSTVATIMGTAFHGQDGSHRLAADISGASGQNINFTPGPETNVTTILGIEITTVGNNNIAFNLNGGNKWFMSGSTFGCASDGTGCSFGGSTANRISHVRVTNTGDYNFVSRLNSANTNSVTQDANDNLLWQGFQAQLLSGSYTSSADETASIGDTTLTATGANYPGAGEYEYHIYVMSDNVCSVAGPAAVTVGAKWTDVTGVQKTNATIPLDVNGSATLGTSLGLGNTTGYASGTFTIFANGSTNIIFNTTLTACTTGTAKYRIYVMVEYMHHG